MQILDDNKETDLNELKTKVQAITRSCSKPYFRKTLEIMIETNPENCNYICDYILAEQSQINLKDSTKEGKIKVLTWLSTFLGGKPFNHATKQDILSYLDSLGRPLSEDANRKWIGSYNSRQMILNKFFRWQYNPDETDQNRIRRFYRKCLSLAFFTFSRTRVFHGFESHRTRVNFDHLFRPNRIILSTTVWI